MFAVEENKWHTYVFMLLFSCSVVPDSLQPRGLQHTRLPCPSLTPRACSDSCPLSQWCHPTTSFCFPLLLLPSIFPNIRVFSTESLSFEKFVIKGGNWRVEFSWMSLFQCSVLARWFTHRMVSVSLSLLQSPCILMATLGQKSLKLKGIPILCLVLLIAISAVFLFHNFYLTLESWDPSNSCSDQDLVFASSRLTVHPRCVFYWMLTTAGMRKSGTTFHFPIFFLHQMFSQPNSPQSIHFFSFKGTLP